MANHKSSEKRARQTVKKTLQNKIKKSEAKTAEKSLRTAIKEGNKDLAMKLLPKVQSLFGKLSKKRICSKKSSARKASRLTKQITKLA